MIELMELAMEVDPKNAEYIANDYSIRSEYETAQRIAEEGDHELADYCITICRRKAEAFNEQAITPANVEVGEGVSVCLWGDRHAATVIKITKKTVTVRYDKATLDPNFKPEFVVGGFAGHCVNQEDQTYTYEEDPDGRIETFYWSRKYNSYGTPGNPRLIKGRHEFYDYNF